MRRLYYFEAQPDVRSPLRAKGLPLTKTLDAPPTATPPQPVRSPTLTAGLPLMKTFGEPSTAACPSSVLSPLRAAACPPTLTLPLPSTMTPGAPPGRLASCAQAGAAIRSKPNICTGRRRIGSCFILRFRCGHLQNVSIHLRDMAEAGPQMGNIARRPAEGSVERRPRLRFQPPGPIGAGSKRLARKAAQLLNYTRRGY